MNIDWQSDRNDYERAEIERDGFRIVLRKVIDTYPDLDWLGTYSMKDPGGYVIDRKHGFMLGPTEHVVKDFAGTDEKLEWEQTQSEYWELHIYDDLSEQSAEYTYRPVIRDVRSWYSSRNDMRYFVASTDQYGEGDWKHPDFPKWFEQDYNRMEDYNRMHWCMLGIIAEVYLGGTFLGSDALWGVESDSEDYIDDEVVPQVIEEAIAEAKENLGWLCEQSQEVLS